MVLFNHKEYENVILSGNYFTEHTIYLVSFRLN